jgi:hypothetical protein
MRIWKILIPLVVLSLFVAFVFIAVPARPGSQTRAFLGIVSTLRQIEGAKEQYSIDHKVPPGSIILREQLLEYVPERFWNPHVEYHINVLGVFPEAVLPSRFDSLPAKTIIRFQTNSPGYQIVPPNTKIDCPTEASNS